MSNTLDKKEQNRVLTTLNDAMIWFQSMDLSTAEGIKTAKETRVTALDVIKPLVEEMYEREMPIS